ncbi:hypothetical protein NDU88_008470, partial [Pleurodeles waltl]
KSATSHRIEIVRCGRPARTLAVSGHASICGQQKPGHLAPCSSRVLNAPQH